MQSWFHRHANNYMSNVTDRSQFGGGRRLIQAHRRHFLSKIQRLSKAVARRTPVAGSGVLTGAGCAGGIIGAEGTEGVPVEPFGVAQQLIGAYVGINPIKPGVGEGEGASGGAILLAVRSASARGPSRKDGSPPKGSMTISGSMGAKGEFSSDSAGSEGCVGVSGESEILLPQRVRAQCTPSLKSASPACNVTWCEVQ